MSEMTQGARIEQFRRMVEADPDNELGQFSLGKAYHDAGRVEEATHPLQRTIELNPRLSKAYELLGDAYQRIGRKEEAIRVLQEGVNIAGEQGDRMPALSMINLLTGMGAHVPQNVLEVAQEESQSSSVACTADTGFACSRCGSPSGKMENSPFKGAQGSLIQAKTCERCWREWIPTGTKVINELGLELADHRAQQTYDQYMIEFLNLPRE